MFRLFAQLIWYPLMMSASHAYIISFQSKTVSIFQNTNRRMHKNSWHFVKELSVTRMEQLGEYALNVQKIGKASKDRGYCNTRLELRVYEVC